MKTFYRGYKFKLYPTEEQAKQIEEFFHLTRSIYNWGVALEIKTRKDHKRKLVKFKRHSNYELRALFREERNKENSKFDFFKNVPSETGCLVMDRVWKAFDKYYAHENNHPKFRTKKKPKNSFTTRYDRFYIRNDKIKIEGISSYIDIGFNCGLWINKASNPVVSKDDLGDYYISFSLEEEVKPLDIPTTEGIGIDLGIRQNIVLSDGTVYNQPNEKIAKLDRKRRKLQKHVNRDIDRRYEESKRTRTKYEDIPKSKRAIKRENRLYKYNKKIYHIKDTWTHTTTKRIVERNPQFVCMETVSTQKICKNANFMHNVMHKISFYNITETFKEKCEERGIKFIQAPTEFPSTKTCSRCGHVKEMMGSQCKYRCKICGLVEDRDINAAINLKNYGMNFYSNNISILE